MKTPSILFLGDSLTYGYNVSSNDSFPSIIGKKLNRKFVSKKIKIINAGVPGDTTKMALLRLDSYLKNYFIVMGVIFLGANDYLLQENTENIYHNLKEIIHKLKNHHKIKILLIEFLPFQEYQRKEFKGIYEKLKIDFPDIVLIPDVMEEIIQNPELVLDDGIHPNEKGYQIIANKIYPFIEKELSNVLSY
jgi:acyl-CoA thioesterase-1